MVVGILSDTHLAADLGKLTDLLAGPLAIADVLLHAGDHVSMEVVDHLEFVDQRIYHGVAGNMDSADILARLGKKKLVNLGGLTVGLAHGWGAGEGLELRIGSIFSTPPDLLVFGHSHRPLVRRIGPTLYLNPGSPFSPRGGPGTVLLVTIGEGGPQVRLIEV